MSERVVWPHYEHPRSLAHQSRHTLRLPGVPSWVRMAALYFAGSAFWFGLGMGVLALQHISHH